MPEPIPSAEKSLDFFIAALKQPGLGRRLRWMLWRPGRRVRLSTRAVARPEFLNLVNRARVAATQTQVNDALKSLNAADPTSTLGRFEERIRRDEATVRGQQELASSSLEAQFASLEDLGEQTEIEARLAALKQGTAQKAIDY
jgi:hypothetical protein